ncbi:oocyte zinc finger protein XlCOF14-like [Mycetomoellerius zeteki]|uniref:oocyte zinc finger protein XlCOF14-like n=1 Tax=Mycetomoellerius zeteki TaxID=64791 RepID=UPI00084E8767|nr:PREDICTED: oocyte zinc finger protein XlCOF14-like [Trachymyrmex zeteki]
MLLHKIYTTVKIKEWHFNTVADIDPLALSSQQIKSIYRSSEGQIVMEVQQPKNFPCPRCGRCYKVKRSLRRHIVVECGKAPKHKCPYCKHQSKYKASITKHITHVHPNLPFSFPND